MPSGLGRSQPINHNSERRRARGWITGALLAALAAGPLATAQQARPPARDITATAQFAGRNVEGVRIEGNQTTPSTLILANIRTRAGEPYDPLTVQEDYQRIYRLRRFANVTARVEPTEAGVVVVFTVVERKAVGQILFEGNANIDSDRLRNAIDLRPDEAIDAFRIGLARRAIEAEYRKTNFTFAQVTVDQERLTRDGDVVFQIVEGPKVFVRNVTFPGNIDLDEGKLRSSISTRTWVPILRRGQLSMENLEQDVATIRRLYLDNGFLDARVGRRLVFSPDQREVQVDFMIDQGPRYRVTAVQFRGNESLDEQRLRQELKLLEGQFWDADLLRRDVRAIIRAYGPLGFIHRETDDDPDFLRVNIEPVFSQTPGEVTLVYDIREGRPFRVGEILPRGNTRTQDKVILREFRLGPGDVYDSGKILDATERLRASPAFAEARITPVGDDPNVRDLIVEVTERDTASISVGGSISSAGGIAGRLEYRETNFDISAWPSGFSDMFGPDRTAFRGAGQFFSASFQPGTRFTSAGIRFVEPWLFDQPYSLAFDAYLRNRRREAYVDQRLGGRVALTRRFDDVYSATLSTRLERFDIRNIFDKPARSFEILDGEGDGLLTSVGIAVQRNTTNPGLLTYEGSRTVLGWDSVGALGGDVTYQRFNLGWEWFIQLHEDLQDRKTVLRLNADTTYLAGNAPFFERLYGGGPGSLRGFAFRGVSPRDGPADDRIGGEFAVLATAEVGFPLQADWLRGVVFLDFGTVEPDVRVGTIRSTVGAGLRLTLPFAGQVPIALDFGLPLTKDDTDDTQIFSFSLGFTQ